MDKAQPDETTPINSSPLGEESEGSTDYKTWEWWERPKDAKGVSKHLRLSTERPSSSRSGKRKELGVSIDIPDEKAKLLNYKDDKDDKDDKNSLSLNGGGEDEIGSLAPKVSHPNKLNQYFATAISGNDITSSVLYVSGYASVVCGVWAPISLVMVSVLLALFRPIYTEVVTALPMNGGTYNALLNTTSKKVASVAGALSLLSYIATAVVSATSAMQYLQALWSDLDLRAAVVILLGLFAVLNLLGLTESAVVATILFFAHCTTLLVLIAVCTIHFCGDNFRGFSLLKENWHTHYGPQDNFAKAIYLGYGASMLGITGFETSANFVEEQAPGVFPKTLRNMWYAVAFFNPVLSFLSFGLLKLDVATDPSQSGALLTHMGRAAGGEWLAYWVSIDAVLVLSGAVLTAYVGVTGLARRLALDRILAQFLLQENKLRRTNHWIIIGFFLLCTSLFFIVDAKTDTLSGVYTSAFLCVMAMFAVGNMMLKYKRSKLPRELYTPWPVVVAAFFGVVAAFIANAIYNTSVLLYFVIYFGGTMFLFMMMFWRIRVLKIVLYFCKLVIKNPGIHTAIEKKIQQLNSSKVIFFTREDTLAVLNKALLYIRDNEQTNWVIIAHVYKNKEDIPPKLEENCRLMEQAWPKYRIDFVTVQGEFIPQTIDLISNKLGVPKNFMFITTPSAKFTHKLSDLGGVRLVTH